MGERHRRLLTEVGRFLAVGGVATVVAVLLFNPLLATMALPMMCLAVSHDVLGLDDPVSDNVAANVIGLALGVTSRFWIFRTFVFRRPAVAGELLSAPRDRSSAGRGRAPARGAAGD